MTKKDEFKVKFWGVRGSYPVANKDFLKYGGNTSCVEIIAGNHRIILDGGTGIIPLGDKIYKEHIFSAQDANDHVNFPVSSDDRIHRRRFRNQILTELVQ